MLSNTTWTASSDAGWATVSSENRSALTVTYSANDTVTSRVAVITLTTTAGTPQQTVRITLNQMGTGAPAPTLALTSHTDGGQVNLAYNEVTPVNITINAGGGATGWEASMVPASPDFFTLSHTNGGPGVTNLTATFNENMLNTERKVTVTFTSLQAVGMAAVTQTLSFTQAATTTQVLELTLTVEGENVRDINAAVGTETFVIASNASWQVNTAVSWIDTITFTPENNGEVVTVTPDGEGMVTLEGSGNGNLVVSYQANAGAARQGALQVAVYVNNEALTEPAPVSITLNQKAFEEQGPRAIEELSGLAVYPNPVHNELFITNNTQQAVHVVISDITGQEVARYTLHHEDIIDFTALPTGLYIILLQNDIATLVQRVVKH